MDLILAVRVLIKHVEADINWLCGSDPSCITRDAAGAGRPFLRLIPEGHLDGTLHQPRSTRSKRSAGLERVQQFLTSLLA